MAEHPWCRDVARDEAVRAAEDAAERPAVPEWRELPDRVARLEREVAAMRGTPVEAEGKAETTDGLRTERVTLEITRPHRPNYPASATDFTWPHILREVVHGERESVRVVPASDGEAEVERLRAENEGLRNRLRLSGEATYQEAGERLAAIRERDAALARVAELEAQVPTAPSDLGIWGTAKELSERCKELAARLVCVSMRTCAERDNAIRERDAALARVAELEAKDAPGLRSLAENLRDKLRDCESALKRSEARVAELEEQRPRDLVEALEARRPGAEPVAFQVQLFKGCTLTYQDRQAAQDKANAEGGGTVVPLYRAPPQPRGWLTQEEREAVRFFADWKNGEVRMVEEIEQQQQISRLLARNTPPKVRLPLVQTTDNGSLLLWDGRTLMLRDKVIAALAAAGVEVEE